MQWIVSELRTRGSVRRATLGVTTVDLPQQIAVKLNLPIRNGGAYVIRVKPGSPADKAKLQSGDTILQVAEQSVHSPTELSSIIEQSPIDEPLVIQLIRNEKRMELSITLTEK